MRSQTLHESEVYYVVWVELPALAVEGTEDLVATTRSMKRFEFRGPDAQQRAVNCYKAAKRAGLEVRPERVRAYKGERIGS